MSADLIARLEAAPGGSRELDALVHFTMNRKWIGRIPVWPPERIRETGDGDGMQIEGSGYLYGDDVPHLTSSIDAALTLIPEHYRLGTITELQGEEPRWVVKLFNRGSPGGLPACGAATPALAIAAACLRARAALGDEP